MFPIDDNQHIFFLHLYSFKTRKVCGVCSCRLRLQIRCRFPELQLEEVRLQNINISELYNEYLLLETRRAHLQRRLSKCATSRHAGCLHGYDSAQTLRHGVCAAEAGDGK